MMTHVPASCQTHPVPHFWKYEEARRLFLDKVDREPVELIWREPDEEALVGFLCHVKHVKYVLLSFAPPPSFLLDSNDCSPADVFSERRGSAIEWRSFARHGKVSERRGRRRSQWRGRADRLAWRTSSESPEQEVW